MAASGYVLSQQIARGGMAEIYLGKAVGGDSFQRIVAIKRILPHYAQDNEFLQMFRDEAHICKRLQHANVVQVFDFCEVEGSFALIMEFVDGSDFRTLLSACESAGKRLSVPMALYIIACAARGLHYAHTKTDEISGQPLGIIHRDVSPQNILISYEGEVKITDFGIASAEDKITETRPGVVKGKYSYMSPEQVSAQHIDGRTDVFSLCIVLWEALAMRRLFSGKSEVETIRKVQSCTIPGKLTAFNKNVDTALMDLVHHGLDPNPTKRFQSAAELEKALLKYLHKRFPDFVSGELGHFLKQVLAKKWNESRQRQKDVLTNSSATAKITPQPASPVTKPPSEAPLESSQSQPHPLSQDSIPLASQAQDILGPPPAQPQSKVGESSIKHPLPPQVANARSRLQPSTIGKENSNRSTPIIFSIAAGILLCIVAGTGWYMRQNSIQGVHIQLSTQPSPVQIFINGTNIQAQKGGGKNRFTQTPYEILLPADGKRHRVDIRRPGFNAQYFEFKAEAGKEIPPVATTMSPKRKEPLGGIKITSNQELEVDLNNGLLIGATPLKQSQVLLKGRQTLEYRLKKGSGNKRYRCLFSFPKPHRGAFQLEVTFNRKYPTGRCTARKL